MNNELKVPCGDACIVGLVFIGWKDISQFLHFPDNDI